MKSNVLEFSVQGGANECSQVTRQVVMVTVRPNDNFFVDGATQLNGTYASLHVFDPYNKSSSVLVMAL